MATTRKTTNKTTDNVVNDDTIVAAEAQEKTASAPKKSTARKRTKLSALDPNELVELQSCVEGRLIYVSHSGYYMEWAEFGDVHLVPVSELLNMRNEQPAFFRNHWVYPVSTNADEIISSLQLDRYYNRLSDLKNFDDLFSYTPEQIEMLLRDEPPIIKENVARRCGRLVEEGIIDSVVVMDTIERITGYTVRNRE